MNMSEEIKMGKQNNMGFIKRKKHLAMKYFTLTVLSVFVFGILSVPAHTFENLDVSRDSVDTKDALAEAVWLTIHVAHLDINPEEKIEILADALGWDCSEPLSYNRTIDAVTTATPHVCNQYLLAAIVADSLDNFIPPVGFVTGILYLAAVLCYLGVI